MTLNYNQETIEILNKPELYIKSDYKSLIKNEKYLFFKKTINKNQILSFFTLYNL